LLLLLCYVKPHTYAQLQALEHHIREEEDEMLAEFAGLVQRDDLAHLAEKFQKSKMHVPTR
jgi:hypothetical protein